MRVFLIFFFTSAFKIKKLKYLYNLKTPVNFIFSILKNVKIKILVLYTEQLHKSRT